MKSIKKRSILMGAAGALALATGIFSFTKSGKTIPEGAVAVTPFDKGRYLGKWYEIARLDFRFEKGLNNTTANYSLNENGTIKVVNRGYDYAKNKWKQSTG